MSLSPADASYSEIGSPLYDESEQPAPIRQLTIFGMRVGLPIAVLMAVVLLFVLWKYRAALKMHLRRLMPKSAAYV